MTPWPSCASSAGQASPATLSCRGTPLPALGPSRIRQAGDQVSPSSRRRSAVWSVKEGQGRDPADDRERAHDDDHGEERRAAGSCGATRTELPTGTPSDDPRFDTLRETPEMSPWTSSGHADCSTFTDAVSRVPMPNPMRNSPGQNLQAEITKKMPCSTSHFTFWVSRPRFDVRLRKRQIETGVVLPLCSRARACTKEPARIGTPSATYSHTRESPQPYVLVCRIPKATKKSSAADRTAPGRRTPVADRSAAGHRCVGRAARSGGRRPPEAGTTPAS